jgi:hypothetical protein
MIEIAPHKLELLLRIAPPLGDVRRIQPRAHQRQVSAGHRAKLVGSLHHVSFCEHALYAKSGVHLLGIVL